MLIVANHSLVKWSSHFLLKDNKFSVAEMPFSESDTWVVVQTIAAASNIFFKAEMPALKQVCQLQLDT
jgi:hypothetical protein